jgi:hypothetical protein
VWQSMWQYVTLNVTTANIHAVSIIQICCSFSVWSYEASNISCKPAWQISDSETAKSMSLTKQTCTVMYAIASVQITVVYHEHVD